MRLIQGASANNGQSLRTRQTGDYEQKLSSLLAVNFPVLPDDGVMAVAVSNNKDFRVPGDVPPTSSLPLELLIHRQLGGHTRTTQKPSQAQKNSVSQHRAGSAPSATPTPVRPGAGDLRPRTRQPGRATRPRILKANDIQRDRPLRFRRLGPPLHVFQPPPGPLTR